MPAGKKNKLLLNFFSLGIVQAIIALLQLIVIPHVIKRIGAEGFGVIAVAQVVMFYLSAVTDYGFNQTATRDVALYREDGEKISRIFFRVLFSKILLCFIAFILLLVVLLIFPLFRSHASLYLLAFVYVAAQSILLTWFFQGMERMQFIALATLLARVIFVILVFVFIRDKDDDLLFLFFLGAGNFLAGILSVFAAWRLFRLKFIKPSRADILQELKDGWHVTVANLSSFTCQYSNVLILRVFTNDLVVGYYSIAERIFFTIRQVLGIFSQAIYPVICQLVQKGKDQLVSFFKKVYLPFLLCVCCGSIILFIFSPQVLYFFLGDEYHHSVFFLRVMSVVSVIVCLAIPAALTLLGMNEKKKYFKIYALGTVMNILSNIILVYYFKATGTVMAVFITELFIMAGLTREVYRATGRSSGLVWKNNEF